MDTPKTRLEGLKRLRELHGAWQRLYQTANAHPQDRAAHQVAAIQALDLHAANLRLVHQCRQEYGGYPDVGHHVPIVTDIEAWATLAPAAKGTEWDYYSLSMESPAPHWGHSWGEQLEHWMGKCAEAAGAAMEEAAAGLSDIGQPSPGAVGAVFPWGRAILAFGLLIVLELIAVIAAWLWGQGDNPLQKIGNCWWLLASLLPVVALVSRLILGRKGWSQVKKMWHSWRGEA